MPTFAPMTPTIPTEPKLPIFVLGPVGARQPTPTRVTPTITVEERTPSGAVVTTTKAAAAPASPRLPGGGAAVPDLPVQPSEPPRFMPPQGDGGQVLPDLPVVPQPEPVEPLEPQKWSPWIVGAIGLVIGLAIAR